ncbi:hypothetical protein PGT21_033811 [Puccinia graminis f. sp. tritici]|uniref:Uncharacterized protein n=1 Tax=Puccinia graminis f. sp. tritici TaxID=56615 RepID=A0A5B0QA15_PUCGR|nr:hypothetical protein PGT21_033811 [Puccinia graminis f. sp. tritici]KAA1109803.1 hypothetical protein PGTUg99_035335 [Puccinia graminis f. sp. tritici]
MPKQTTNFRLNGKPSSIRVQNKHSSTWLPSSNSAFSQSVYDFIKLLIDHKQLPQPVTDDQLAAAEALEKHRLQDQTCFFNFDLSSDQSELAGKKKSISTKYKLLFLDDIKNMNLTHHNFDYAETASSTWNTILMKLLCKHWLHAHSQNAFDSYPINVKHLEPENLYGVILRWFNGKKVFFARKKPEDPTKKAMQRRNWSTRKTLRDRRVASLEVLGINPECCKPFEEPLCHSDTEELEDMTLRKVKLPWRSPALAALCEVADRVTIQRMCPAKKDRRLLETRRRPAQSTNDQAKVPMNLCGDSYDGEFFKFLPEPEQKHLTRTPPSGLADFYCKVVQEHPHLFDSPVFSVLSR